MADFRRYFPLSNREPVDETNVTGDWRRLTSESALRTADLLHALPASSWPESTMRRVGRNGRMTVTAVADQLAHRLESSRLELLFPSAAAERSPGEIVAALRRAAAAPLRRGVADLAATALACYDISYPLGLGDPLDPTASGAAVLARAAAAPPAIRSILRQRTLAPVDATWRIGSGPDIRATSAVLLLWVAGRDVLPEFA